MIDSNARRSQGDAHFSAMRIIESQVQKKLEMKRSVKKKLKQVVERVFRHVSHSLLSRPSMQVKKYDGSSVLGADEFNRDVADGISKYVELLRRRGLRIHAVVVLGSRAKGRWKPTSDVDVTIIGSDLPAQKEGFSLKKLLGIGSYSLLSDKPLSLGIEPSGCCSKGEFLKRIERLNVEALDALYYGIVFYDDGFWKEAKQKMLDVERQYELRETEMKETLQQV